MASNKNNNNWIWKLPKLQNGYSYKVDTNLAIFVVDENDNRTEKAKEIWKNINDWMERNYGKQKSKSS